MSNTKALVDADWLRGNLDNKNVHIVEVDVNDKSFSEGHLPGAVLWNIYSDLKDDSYHLRSDTEIESLIQHSGITRDSTIVFCGYAPALGFWLMSLFGHNDLQILNVNKASWHDKGYPLTAEETVVEKSDFRINKQNGILRTEHKELVEIVNTDGHRILDVRSKQEYDGERFWPSGGIPEGGRAGHIPSAANVPADGIVKDDGSFASAEELEQLLSRVDLSKNEDVITYCTVGARASTVWFAVTQILGYKNVRVYDGSWACWGMDPNTEIS